MPFSCLRMGRMGSLANFSKFGKFDLANLRVVSDDYISPLGWKCRYRNKMVFWILKTLMYFDGRLKMFFSQRWKMNASKIKWSAEFRNPTGTSMAIWEMFFRIAEKCIYQNKMDYWILETLLVFRWPFKKCFFAALKNEGI